MYIDAHAHIATSKKLLKQVATVIADAKENKISYIIDSSHDARSSEKTLKLSRKYRDILLPTLGIHPEIVTLGSDIYRKDFNLESELKQLRKLFQLGRGEFVAVGECGLDYYWINTKSELKSHKSELKEKQKQVFASQIQFAQEVNLPLVIHSRGAEKECLRILQLKIKNQKLKVPVLFHSYTGSSELAKRIFDAGYYISFNNIISYPKSDEVREIFRLGWNMYREQILAETDAPYLPPQQRRGEICFPSDVRYVVDKMAELTRESTQSIAKMTSRNAETFYNL